MNPGCLAPEPVPLNSERHCVFPPLYHLEQSRKERAREREVRTETKRVQRIQQGGNRRKGMVRGRSTENSMDGPGRCSGQRGCQLKAAEVGYCTGENCHLTEETGLGAWKAESYLCLIWDRDTELNKIRSPLQGAHCHVGRGHCSGHPNETGLGEPSLRPIRCDSDR